MNTIDSLEDLSSDCRYVRSTAFPDAHSIAERLYLVYSLQGDTQKADVHREAVKKAIDFEIDPEGALNFLRNEFGLVPAGADRSINCVA